MAGLGAGTTSGGTVEAGNITVTPTTYTAGVIKPAFGEKSGNFSFAAGAYRAKIWVVSFGEQVVVNGDIVKHGESVWEKEFQTNEVDKIQDFLTAINVVAATDIFWGYRLEYPSSSSVDVSSL